MTDSASTATQGTRVQNIILKALEAAIATHEHLRNASLFVSPLEQIALAPLLKDCASLKDRLAVVLDAVGDPRVTPTIAVEGVPCRTLNLLVGAGVETMEAAKALDEKLLDIEGFGQKSLAQVRAWKKP